MTGYHTIHNNYSYAKNLMKIPSKIHVLQPLITNVVDFQTSDFALQNT